MHKVIALGTFPFANPFSKADKKDATDIVNSFLDSGGRRIDTAPTYSFGEVEKLLGGILSKRNRDEYEIVSSCGYVRDGNSYKISGHPQDVRKDVEESLERLGLDYIDIYYSHIPDPSVPFSDTAGALNQLRDEGLIRQVGVSNVDMEQLLDYQLGGKIDFIQNRFSFLNRAISNDFMIYAKKQNIQISVYQAIERGLLTDRGPSINQPNDLRRRKPEFEIESMNLLRSLIQKYLKPVCDEYSISLKNAIIMWTLNILGITAIQLGATRVSDVTSLPFDQSLDPAIFEKMEKAYKEISLDIAQKGYLSIQNLMGLDTYDIRSGSASGL